MKQPPPGLSGYLAASRHSRIGTVGAFRGSDPQAGADTAQRSRLADSEPGANRADRRKSPIRSATLSPLLARSAMKTPYSFLAAVGLDSLLRSPRSGVRAASKSKSRQQDWSPRCCAKLDLNSSTRRATSSKWRPRGARRRRLPGQRPLVFRQRHSSCGLGPHGCCCASGTFAGGSAHGCPALRPGCRS
jgi:hypothetical protein